MTPHPGHVRPMPSALKKVIVRTRDGERAAGFLDPQRLAGGDPIELLSADGERVTLDGSQILTVFFVQDFEVAVPPRRNTSLPPPGPGLWVRLRFQDHESIEAVAANELMNWGQTALELTPLSASGACSRIWVPRQALESVQVLAVLSAPIRRAPSSPTPRRRPAKAPRDQFSLFSEEPAGE